MEKLLEILENVYKCPVVVLDKNEALDKIMKIYAEVRKEDKHD